MTDKTKDQGDAVKEAQARLAAAKKILNRNARIKAIQQAASDIRKAKAAQKKG